mmetsp:Transcript_84132/g.242912  ORF Transcript_84132/g.242912 Transcript_84132/m.242912 type:complete len:590 (-) Transcript_84132:162-1931(-)|eukprot:CAMPEP_0170227156 /NCGR_PEP_ID=MMETSP0116_2-20130129/13292_1 /TAXON_ID=400756 /ORGANISM="Durinskia baltica, Strain CSIRO CS-38" /LENGTH=589 /DNA_ID=CAMNT_0010477887 /DNA_START=108 /DNA_END=1877 /DNA_ORIENTATION=+
MPFQWRVVGGKDTGGILVRKGQDLKSDKVDARLATDALVDQIELRGDRLHYRLAQGTGPSEGWVSLKISGKDLVEFVGWAEDPEDDRSFDKWSVLGRTIGPEDKPPSEAEMREESAERIRSAVGRPYVVLGLEPGAGSKSIRRAYHILALLHHPDKGGDAAVFKAINDAYRGVTQSRDESGGWKDLEGSTMPPWQAHSAQGTKGVSVVLFDAFGTPPWESRRLYTACWQEGCVKCWELSPPLTNRQPRLVGEIAVGGFINDVAALSPFGLLTAQSAGMKPQPGESLRTWNLKQTPFRPTKRAVINAIKDDGGRPATALEGGTGPGRPGTADTSLVVKDDADGAPESDALVAVDEYGYLGKSQMVFLHYRGVRSISLWPSPGMQDSTPHLAGTVSKDYIAVSKIGIDGCSLQPAEWKQSDPHDMTDINVLRHESANKMWSGDNSGVVKCWDINASGRGLVASLGSGASGWLSGMELWEQAGMMCCSHSSGIVFVDTKSGQMVSDMKKKESVLALTALGSNSQYFFAGVGRDLMQYDTRKWGADLDYRKMAVAMWTLDSPVTALSCAETKKGHLLVAAGCMDGKIAVLDTT